MQKILTIIIVCITAISCSSNRKTVTLYGGKKITPKKLERTLQKDFDRTLRMAKKLERQISSK